MFGRSLATGSSLFAWRTGLLVAALANAGLVIYGALRFRGEPLGLFAALVVLVAYGLAGWFGLAALGRRSRMPALLRIAVVAGLAAGLVFAGEIVLEYVLLPRDNSLMGTVEFGTVYALYFVAAAVAGYRHRSARAGSLAAVCAALAGSLIWLAALLIVFYAFYGTPQQAQVFRAEGNYEDFVASGATNFDTFVIGDFYGAAFFHLLLGPTVAGILGLVAGGIGKGLARLTKVRTRPA